MSSAVAADDTLGGKIQAAREARGYSIAELSRKVAVNADTVANWERDRSEPRANKLMMLAGVLNVSPLWLMGTASDPMNDNVGLSEDDTFALRQKVDRLESLLAQSTALLSDIRGDLSRLQDEIDEQSSAE